ncbi:MAG: hypothetical protein M3N93_01225 [Acidobacteriota bacterium]|nr:hypothetical protein [Acidobacteriota bacterium]
MRAAFTRGVFLGCVCALVSLAQQQLTVDKLVEFITSSIGQKQPDKDVAGILTTMKLSEKLSPRVVEDLQGKGAGPRTVAALTRLAETSATLPAPAPKATVQKPKLPPAPPYEEQQTILREAREYALNYSKMLPDFVCLQVTHRYIDRHYKPGTEGSWAVSDMLAEKLSYFDQHEKYEPISQNGNSLYGKTEPIGGALSRGDFGTMLREIFAPESDAEFHWERWGNIDSHWMNVYTYLIDQIHSHETLDFDHSQQSTPGYHGEVFVEKGPNVIWRITVEPEPPASFPMQNIHEQLDYRYTDISGQKFLLPQRGEIVMRSQGVGSKNEIDFRTYRKYSADTSITFDDGDDKTAPGQPEGDKAPQPQK